MTDPGEWLISRAKRHPEALLVMGAGCLLLMRRGGSSQNASARTSNDVSGRGGGGTDALGLKVRLNVSQATEKASAVVTDIRDRVADAATSVADYAGGVGQTISAQTTQMAGRAQSTLQAGFAQLLREQPLALVALGLAAGAAVATLVPATDVEERTLAGARNAIAGVAGNVIDAASDAGHQLSQGITDRASQGFKEVVHEVAEKFHDKVVGKTEAPESAQRSNVSTPQTRES